MNALCTLMGNEIQWPQGAQARQIEREFFRQFASRLRLASCY